MRAEATRSGVQRLCLPLPDATDPDVAGGKAANLARAHGLGFRVPETVVVAREALRRVLSRSDLRTLLRSYLDAFAEQTSGAVDGRHRELTLAFHAAGIPGDVRAEIVESAERLLETAPAGLAVRSSAVYEDREAASFAGVFDSYVGITDRAELLRRVVDCWCSSWSPRAIRYLSRMGIEPSTDAMAVIVQHVVPASAAGVLHTADADTGDPSRIVLHAARGLAVDLMSGSGAADVFRIDWETSRVLSREPYGPRPAVSDAELARVTATARRLDEAWSMRLDVEWAIADEVFVVQVRPLTALPVYFPDGLPAADRASTWRRAQWVLPLRNDLPEGLLTPLYADMSESELWYRHQPSDIVLTGIWTRGRDVNGYRYTDDGPRPSFLNHFTDLADFEPWLERNEPPYRRRWETRHDELRGIAETARSAIERTRTAAELVPTMLSVRDRFWDLNAFGWSGPQSLGWMCEGLLALTLHKLGAKVDTASLISGGADSHTFEVTLALQELGRSIDEPDVRDVFAQRPLAQVTDVLRQTSPRSAFLASYEALCRRFGRTPPSWRDRPAFWRTYFDEGDAAAMRTIRAAHRGESRDVRLVQVDARRERERAEAAIRAEIVAKSPDLAERFDRMLEWTRYWTQALNDRHGIATGLLWERELVWTVGSRLRDEGLVGATEDVLVLRADDLQVLARGQAADAFATVYESRLREYRRNRRLRAPDVLGEPLRIATAPAAHDDASVQDGELRGTGFGRGSATGRARVVRTLSADLLDGLTADDILVLPYENAFAYADWHSLLTLVKGVVSPSRPAHHLSQVARECGVPVIGQVRGDLRRVRDGDVLLVDASSGTVRLLGPTDPSL